MFLNDFFPFLLSRKLALLTKKLHLTLVKPTLNSQMEIIWQQSFDLLMCNANNFIFMKFIHCTSAFVCNCLVTVVCGA